mmetsp:Transcript_92940/g.289764  ORF Transcript_92940/g.289764 Transcript_92940/m.289764 type:complete len:122 (+) Transcript_92940:106-471(+)
MLLVLGPVSKQHFVGPPLLILIGGAALAVSFILEDPPRYVRFGGIMMMAIGGIMFLAFGVMLASYGWRPDGTSTRTVYSCQFCGATYPTYADAELHERSCPYGTNRAVPIGGAPTVVGLPV